MLRTTTAHLLTSKLICQMTSRLSVISLENSKFSSHIFAGTLYLLPTILTVFCVLDINQNAGAEIKILIIIVTVNPNSAETEKEEVTWQMSMKFVANLILRIFSHFPNTVKDKLSSSNHFCHQKFARVRHRHSSVHCWKCSVSDKNLNVVCKFSK